MTQDDARGECMRLRAVVASLQNSLCETEKYSQFIAGLYMEMKARVIELEAQL